MPLAILLWHKLQAKLQAITSRTTFLLQETLRKIESGSTFCNDCCNATMHFVAIAHCKIPLATCLAIFLLIGQDF